MSRLIGHEVRWDAMGPVMTHPVACSTMRKAIECPHWRALDRGQVLGKPERGVTYTAPLVDGTLVLAAPMTGAAPLTLVNEEILDLLDRYVTEAGCACSIRHWLDRQPPCR